MVPSAKISGSEKRANLFKITGTALMQLDYCMGNLERSKYLLWKT